MRRMIRALVLSVLATVLLTSTVGAQSVSVNPRLGGVEISAELLGSSQTIEAGLGEGEEGFVGGLCAKGDIHTSCTPASEAGGQ